MKRLQERLVCKTKGEGVEILDRDIEVQKMKKAVESLMAANEEKERKIEDLRQCLSRYRKVQDPAALAQGQEGECEGLFHSSSISTLLDAQGFSDLERSTSSTPGMGSPSRDPLHTSAPEEFHTSVLQASVPSLFPTSMDEETCEKPKLATKPETSFEEGDGRAVLGADAEVSLSDGVSTSSLQKSSSLGNLKKETSDGVDKTPTDSHTFGTLPPKAPGHGASVDDSPFGTRKARSSFGRGFFKIKSGKRTASAPNLAETEKETDEHLDLAGTSRPKGSQGTSPFQMSPPSPDSRKKSRGIMRLFGKLRRSQSTTFNPDDMSEPEFKEEGQGQLQDPGLVGLEI